VAAFCDRGPLEPHEADTTEQGGYGEVEASGSASRVDHDPIVASGCDTQADHGDDAEEHALSVRVKVDPGTSPRRSRSPTAVSIAVE
jgi:hypothetical protein